MLSRESEMMLKVSSLSHWLCSVLLLALLSMMKEAFFFKGVLVETSARSTCSAMMAGTGGCRSADGGVEV